MWIGSIIPLFGQNASHSMLLPPALSVIQPLDTESPYCPGMNKCQSYRGDVNAALPELPRPRRQLVVQLPRSSGCNRVMPG